MIQKNKLLIAVADCTGHGVPGAFMSMLGISFLNEIVAQSEFTTTSSVLNKLREYIVKSLQQHGVIGEQKDGMDISIIAIDLETYKMQFSGANNPCYIIQNNPVSLSEVEDKGVGNTLSTLSMTNKLLELKPDKMPVAIHVTMDDFTNHEMHLQEGDSLYLFSDGIADQFGGPKGRKFMNAQFKELLLSVSNKPMKEQGIEIERKIESWMSDFETKYNQTDDITILGIKI